MIDDRYQNQPLSTKTYRWIKWKPLYFMKAFFYVMETLINKNLLWDPYEKSYFRRKFIFELIISKADTKMKHYYNLDEVKLNLKL